MGCKSEGAQVDEVEGASGGVHGKGNVHRPDDDLLLVNLVVVPSCRLFSETPPENPDRQAIVIQYSTCRILGLHTSVRSSSRR